MASRLLDSHASPSRHIPGGPGHKGQQGNKVAAPAPAEGDKGFFDDEGDCEFQAGVISSKWQQIGLILTTRHHDNQTGGPGHKGQQGSKDAVSAAAPASPSKAVAAAAGATSPEENKMREDDEWCVC